jgi:heparan sulfate N-deacetylase/N-sulfotransferase NDST2
LRAKALVPQARIIVILISATKRAYSWYQHMRSKRDPIANSFNFYEVITASGYTHNSNRSQTRQLRDLRSRCINPGLYDQHLERWLSFFPPQQLLILDGEELKSDPMSVLDQVQDFLNVEKIDYADLIKYDPRKGKIP